MNKSLKENEFYTLRNGMTWQFKHIGHTGRNIAIGILDEKPLCLFINGRYRMDSKEHSLDIIEEN